jgi:hypothetical protein
MRVATQTGVRFDTLAIKVHRTAANFAVASPDGRFIAATTDSEDVVLLDKTQGCAIASPTSTTQTPT